MHNAFVVLTKYRIKKSTKIHLICSGEPPDVALVIAHAASFLVLNSALPNISINTGKMLALITFWNVNWIKSYIETESGTIIVGNNRYTFVWTSLTQRAFYWKFQLCFIQKFFTWICALLPAVILEIVQHASFRMDSFWLLRRCKRQGSAEQLSITWVCTSSPVTILPTALRAADTTVCWACLKLSNNEKLTNLFFFPK